MGQMRNTLTCMLAFMSVATAAVSQDVTYTINPETGALNSLVIEGDAAGMNWMLRTDGSQYPWITDKYGWGLGYLTVNGERLEWYRPDTENVGGKSVTYKAGFMTIAVGRVKADGGFSETYTFTNSSKEEARLTDIGIYTPFNDNYPDSRTCMTSRCHAHIWTGANTAYVEAVRMSGKGDGIGLVLTDGRIYDYDVWERGQDKGSSNNRGVLALCPQDKNLAPGESMSVSWRVFRHDSRTDFCERMIGLGGAVVSSPKYVYEVGEVAEVTARSANGTQTKTVKIENPGSIDIPFEYAPGKVTYARLLGVSSYEGLIQKRIDFIIDHQQMNDVTDPRYGAYMVYDNETHEIYLNDDSRASSDTDEGRERVGMGVLIAQWQSLHPSGRQLESLKRYAAFLRTKLQQADYTTFSKANHTGKHRGYNYPWIADFYFRMYSLTGDKRYARDGYGTMRAFFRHFGYGFYAIGIPVTLSLRTLDEAGMIAERDTLLADYKATAAVFMKNGLDFPRHEVNYEQTIISPAVQLFCEMNLVTGEGGYLDCARMMMPTLEAFTGRQPTYHMNEIAIRHWDGYWFGKRQLFGDTFPHYWSVLNASTYYYYAKCTGDESYQQRAENIVNNNLCQFFEDGTASCAFVNPRMVNGQRARCFDAFANDQDWALVIYLLVNGSI